MKKTILLVALFVGSLTMAQEVKPQFEKMKDGKVKATYFYSDGTVSQVGYFNRKNQRHGVWVSYDMDGHKNAQARYDKDKRAGKWFFWSKDKLTEVDYKDNEIVALSTWVNKNPVAIN